METEVLKQVLLVYGPIGLGWPIAFLLMRFIMTHMKDSVESNLRLASAIDSLEKWVREAMK